jgi:Zn-finger nucleic acid-binding protein
VDACGRCGGVFLDADELLLLSGDHALNEPLRHRPAHDERSARLCPNCHVRMELDAARGVELEACPRCDGLWLDRGELDRLLGKGPGG